MAHMSASPSLLSNRIPAFALPPAERWGVRIGSLLPWFAASAVLAYALLGTQGEPVAVMVSVALVRAGEAAAPWRRRKADATDATTGAAADGEARP